MKTVIICVRDGIAKVVQCPDDVTVEIDDFDHDEINASANDGPYSIVVEFRAETPFEMADLLRDIAGALEEGKTTGVDPRWYLLHDSTESDEG